MYSVIEIPLGREQAKGAPASPVTPAGFCRRGRGNGPETTAVSKIVDPGQPGTPASASQTSRFTQTASALESGQLARLRPMLPGGVRIDSGMSEDAMCLDRRPSAP